MSYRSVIRTMKKPEIVLCLGGCGKWIAPNKSNRCRRCYELATFKDKASKYDAPQKAIPLVIERRTITIHGIDYDVMADGVGAWKTEQQDTPRNLGCSLLDVSSVAK